MWGGNCSSLNESSRLGEIVEVVKALEEDTKEDIICKLTTPYM